MPNDLSQWTRNFAIIFQKPNLEFLRTPRDLGSDHEEFYGQVFGHAVMILKVGDELVYRGYRPEITSNKEFRQLRRQAYDPEALNPSERRNVQRSIIHILTEGVPAVISDEQQSYQSRHENLLRQSTDTKFVYNDWSLDLSEICSILGQVEQDKRKKKYYSLRPDRSRRLHYFSDDDFVHNCITWIVETVNESLSRQFLPFDPDGNASQFASDLREVGDSR